MDYNSFKKLVEALVAEPIETEWLEFKHNFHSKEEIGVRISALSNSAYLCKKAFGYIVFGIDDDTHKVIGTDLHAKRKKVGNEELESWLSLRLNPRIDFEIIDDFDYEDYGHVCIFKIPAAVNCPVNFCHEDYVRVGSSTRKLKDFPDKESKIWHGGPKPIERIELMSGLSASDVITLLSVETYFDMMHLTMPQDARGVLDRFISEKFVVRSDAGFCITELGALLFAKRLSTFSELSRKKIRVIVYVGKNKIETIREQDFDKGYAVCFEDVVTWINSQLPANEEVGLALRRETRMYPEIAIRELTANMIVHQNFEEQGFPMVELYSDRIEFSNPGQPLIGIDRFIDEYQSRNDSLADIMRRLGICEEKGSGMDKTISLVELYQLPPVRLQVQQTRTTATMFSYRKFANLDKTERVSACYQHACLKYVSNEKMTNQSLRLRLGIDDKNYPMASRIIKDALDAGKIKEVSSEGSNRHTYVPYWA